jgi:hypothetical protein
MSSARYSVRVALANAAKLAGKSIAELESRWVSVDDRLPEVKVGGMERVLVTDGRDVLTAEFYIKEQNLLERETTYEWCTHEPNVSCSMMAECIRFWMPYPSPPKR